MAIKTKDLIIENLQEDMILTKPKVNAIYFKGKTWEEVLSPASFAVADNDLVITPINSEYKITIVDYFKQNGKNAIKYIKTDEFGDLGFLTNIIEEGLVSNPNEIIAQKGNKYTGTVFNDVIEGSGNKDTIKSIEGNDTIYGSSGSDTITSGVGANRIVYDNVNDLDGDFINLTKSEKLTIDVSGIDGINANNISYKVNKNDFNIIIDGKILTIKNFGSKDVTNNGTKKTIDTSSVELYTSAGETIDLRTVLLDKLEVNKNYTGTWHADNIDASTYNNTKNNKGLTIDGKAGNDVILGSNFDDTLKAGVGIDTITGAKGNDKLYAGTDTTSRTTFVFNAQDGSDTIYSGKGEDSIDFKEIDVDDIEFERIKNDLLVKYNNNSDSVLLKNYYDKKGNVISSVKNIILNGQELNLEDFREISQNYNVIFSSSNYINGTNNDDYIMANTGNLIISGNDGNDVIYGASTTTDISSNQGNNTVYMAENSDCAVFLGEGNDTTHTQTTGKVRYYLTGNSSSGGSVNGGLDTIYWNGANTDLFFFKTLYDNIAPIRLNNSDDLLLRYGENNIVTIKDYFKAGNENAQNKIRIQSKTLSGGSTNICSLADFIEGKGGVKNYIEGTTGTNGDDFILATDNNDTIMAGAGNDFIHPKAGNDEIHLGAGNDILYAGSGNKTIFTENGNNVVNLGEGNNNVTLSDGTDTIVSYDNSNNIITFEANDTKSDTLINYGGNTILEFKENDISDLILDDTGDNLVIYRNAQGTKTVELLNTYTSDSNITVYPKQGQANQTELIDLNTKSGKSNSTVSQIIYTGAGNDSIYSGTGNDEIIAGAGTNTIQLEIAESDNINIYSYRQNAVDTFVVNGIENLDGLRFMQTTDDLIIAFNDGNFTSNTLTIQDFYSDGIENKNIKFQAKNGDTYYPAVDLADLMTEDKITKTIYCDENNHTIDASAELKGANLVGCSENDSIIGSSYGDVIYGRGGSDTIRGGEGNDIYVFDNSEWGSGQTVIEDIDDEDTIRIDTTSDKINLFFDVTQNDTVTNGNVDYAIGNDLYINKNSTYSFDNAKTSDGVKIVNYFTEEGKIENIVIPNGNDWISAIKPDIVNAVAQTVANWLKNNGYNSTTDDISEVKKLELVKLYKPLTNSLTNKNIQGTNGNDFIVATEGNSIVSSNKGDDIIYGASSTNAIYANEGNNTVYTAENSDGSVYLSEGNDTLYTQTAGRSWYYVTGNSGSTGPVNGGNDTLYWNGCNAALFFYRTNYDDINVLRSDDDLVLNYGTNNFTLKNYYSAGNENMSNINLDSKNDPEKFYSSWATMVEVLADKGGVGDDIYNLRKNINNIPLRNLTIDDNGGEDILNINNTKNDIYVMFNVKKDGTFAENNDKLIFGGQSFFNEWKNVTHGVMPEDYTCIEINDFDSIETINSNDGYSMDTAKLNALKSDVASWLTSANGGIGYNDVADALAGNDADLETLVAMFNRAENWQAV